MSLFKVIQENCPHCNAIQEIKYYQTVNITLEPNLKEEVLSGTLNSKKCTNCRKEITIFSGLLYHDMENRLMFEVKVSDEQDERKAETLNEFKKNGYIYREVHSYPELVEKIHIFDNKLNDQVVESVSNKLKAMLDESLKQVKETDIEFNVFFKKIEKGLFKKKLVFFCFSHPSQMMEMKYEIKNLSANERKDLYTIDSLRG